MSDPLQLRVTLWMNRGMLQKKKTKKTKEVKNCEGGHKRKELAPRDSISKPHLNEELLSPKTLGFLENGSKEIKFTRLCTIHLHMAEHRILDIGLAP